MSEHADHADIASQPTAPRFALDAIEPENKMTLDFVEYNNKFVELVELIHCSQQRVAALMQAEITPDAAREIGQIKLSVTEQIKEVGIPETLEDSCDTEKWGPQPTAMDTSDLSIPQDLAKEIPLDDIDTNNIPFPDFTEPDSATPDYTGQIDTVFLREVPREETVGLLSIGYDLDQIQVTLQLKASDDDENYSDTKRFLLERDGTSDDLRDFTGVINGRIGNERSVSENELINDYNISQVPVHVPMREWSIGGNAEKKLHDVIMERFGAQV